MTTYFFPHISIMSAEDAYLPNVVLISFELIPAPVDERYIFLSDSMMSGALNSVFTPNPIVSARVKSFVPFHTTILFSENATLPGAPSSQLYPRRAFERVGIVIQISVRGLAPGFVVVPRNLQVELHELDPIASHSSSSSVHDL